MYNPTSYTAELFNRKERATINNVIENVNLQYMLWKTTLVSPPAEPQSLNKQSISRTCHDESSEVKATDVVKKSKLAYKSRREVYVVLNRGYINYSLNTNQMPYWRILILICKLSFCMMYLKIQPFPLPVSNFFTLNPWRH